MISFYAFPELMKKEIPFDRFRDFTLRGYYQVDFNFPSNTYGGIVRFLDFNGFMEDEFKKINGGHYFTFTGPGPIRGGIPGTPEYILESLLRARLEYIQEYGPWWRAVDKKLKPEPCPVPRGCGVWWQKFKKFLGGLNKNA
jgi:hypothetical protein